jgi:hypothetical protein
MATLSSMVEEWISALNAAASAASIALQMDTKSTTTFHNNCAQLIGNNLSFQGLGAKAFENLYTLNEGHAQMAQAKVHDFYNATNNLSKQIEEITSLYDNLNDPGYYTSLSRYGGEIMLQRFLPNLTSGDIYIEILQRLRDSFLQHAQLDDVLDPVNMSSTIDLATNWERGNLMSQVEDHYQTVLQGMKNDLKNNPHESLAQYQIPQLNQDYDTVRWAVQTLVDNMNAQLSSWALALRTLTMTFYSEVLAASKVDQPTVADIIYEFSLPQYADSPVLIYQLSNGGLLIAIKGGTKQGDEQLIRNYIAQYYGDEQNIPQVTILGYQEGTSVAQEIIQESVGPDANSLLPFKVVNAIMIGEKLPDSGTLPINYIDYSLTPNEQKKPWWHLTTEQVTLMTLTAIGAVVLESPELLAGEFTTVFGSLAKDKLMEYAVTLGYNAEHPEDGKTPQEYLYDQLLANNKSTVPVGTNQYEPLRQYIQDQISQGNTYPIDLGKVKQPYAFTYPLNEEPGLKQGLSNDAYLGSQFILDPNEMSKINEGAVTIPTLSPPSTGK